MRFCRLFYVANQKARKAIYNVRVMWNKVHLSLFTASLRCLIPSFIPGIWPFWGLVIVKNKLTSVFYVSVVLLMINFVITMSKFTAEPLASSSWFHSHFDDVMTQFIIDKSDIKNWHQFAKLKTCINSQSGP